VRGALVASGLRGLVAEYGPVVAGLYGSWARGARRYTLVMDESKPAQAIGLTDEMRVAVLENLSDGVYFVDRDRRILCWNKGAEQLTGFSSTEVLGRCCKDNVLNHCDEAGTILCGSMCPLLGTMRDGEQREVHAYLHHRDGHRKPVRIRAAPIRDGAGEIIGAVETFHDDTALIESHRRASELERASMLDPLTGVGNRRLGEAILAGWIEQHRLTGEAFGVLFVDIDNFKAVNDRLGHEVGDDALRIVARTLAETCRHRDEVIRWGGDEFIVLLDGATATTLALVAERIGALLGQCRLMSGARRVELSASIGAALAVRGDSAELIVRRADSLLYQSKIAGRNRVTLDLAGQSVAGRTHVE
jgi:diguanylate cyclase (GGDEF)-like protein/PAS domain S-box-containing protein